MQVTLSKVWSIVCQNIGNIIIAMKGHAAHPATHLKYICTSCCSAYQTNWVVMSYLWFNWE